MMGDTKNRVLLSGLGVSTALALVIAVVLAVRVPNLPSVATCGPVKAQIERIDLGGGSGRRQKLSYPVNDGGNPMEEEYTNELTDHLIKQLHWPRSGASKNASGRLTLRILFVENRYGLNATSRFDQFGARIRLSSPWVRVTMRDWSPCSIQVIFFRQGRQIVRDQMEMHSGRRIQWGGYNEYSDKQMRWFSNQYRYRMLDYNGRFPDKKSELIKLRSEFPSDIVAWAINSPRNMQSVFSIGLDADAHKYIYSGFSKNSMQTLDKAFNNKNIVIHITNITQNNYKSSGYMYPNFKM